MYIPERISFTGRAMAHWIYAGVIDNLSGRKIMKICRDEGYHFSDKSMWDDIRLYRVAHERFEAIQRLPVHMTPSQDYFAFGRDVTIPRRYMYTYHETKTNTETGEVSESYRTYATDILETKQDVCVQMRNDTIMSKYYEHIKVDVSDIVEAYRGGKK